MYERFVMKPKKEFIFWTLIFIPAIVALALSKEEMKLGIKEGDYH